ncbi:F5/8 type C domain-containing protein [Paenibacillus sp. cl141a]|uniref:discoidin domain-containing protein n=1 Tax=Paenibacillus sp. cl141a TaxID=1761877 RepID=UPI0008D0B73F|nr:discoidin domain-containing protein [Paenibacillus sp. cl141a]SEL81276.1 F5/8 type C domain-containing protein [Paenibacillus sp. cl141a]
MAYTSTVNAIPTMTSNTAPSGEASASSSNSSNPAYMAFDKNGSSGAWVSAAGGTTGWIQYKFPYKMIIAKYDIYPQTNLINRAPKSWTFEGSDDGTRWEVLDTQTNIAGWTTNVAKEFTIRNPKEKQYYRLNISANSGDATYLSLNELGMYELIYDRKILLINEGKIKAVVNPYRSENLVPVMTSNIAPSGIVNASSESASNFAAYLAFNGIKGATNSWQSTTAQCWISYQFPVKKVINVYSLTSDTSSRAGYMPKSWNFEGSNDGATWEVLDMRVDQVNWLELETKTFTFNNKKGFFMYRLNILDSNNTRVFLQEMELFYYNLGTIVELDKSTATESDFLTYGSESIDIGGVFDRYTKISYSSSVLGNGKTFEQSFDTSKQKLKKIKFQ